jgi:hypothetical protein
MKHGHEIDPSKNLLNGIITLMLICLVLWFFKI